MNRFRIGLKSPRKSSFALNLLLSVFLVTVLTSCGGESEELSRKKLDAILKDDLSAIVEGVPDSSLLEKPHYELVFYKTYNEGNYSKKAVADFYFMKKVPVKIVRKYRYHVNSRMWDRYYNEYSFFNDSSDAKKGAQ